MDVNLNQLKVFHVAAREGSFTKAAEILCLTQPGISKYIKDLEEYYGVRLFDRLGKRVALTQAGEILYRRTDSIFGMIEQVKVELDELQGLDRGALTVGSSITLGVYVLPEILGRFRAAYPHIDISLDITMNRQVAENVLANRVDVGFLGAPVEDERLKMEAFMQDELVLIIPGSHRWARRDAVEALDLSGETFIYPRRGSGTRDVIEKRMAASGVVLRNTLEIGHTEAVKKAVEVGLGVSILSKAVVVREERLGVIKTLRIVGMDLKRPCYFAYRKDKYLSRVTSTFLQYAVYQKF